MSKATVLLIEEHRVIEQMLDVLESVASKLEKEEQVEATVVERALDFVRNFADRCHHHKEEDLLFASLVNHGLPREVGPIAVMLSEHQAGRAHVRAAAQALAAYQWGDTAKGDEIAQNIRGYVGILRQHIPKEDNVLYPMADGTLSAAELERLLAELERVEREDMGEGVHERYHHLAEELSKALGTGK